MTTAGQTRSLAKDSWLAKPEVGTVLTILSGLSFLGICMILPLVGKAGVHTVHYKANFAAFALGLAITSALSIAALMSKTVRSRSDGSPRPLLSTVLVALCFLLWAALLTGLLKI